MKIDSTVIPDTEHTSDDLIDEFKFHVDRKQDPMRLDHFVVMRMEGMSRNKVQISIKQGAITVNGETMKPSYKLRPNDEIVVIKPKSGHDAAMVLAEDIPLNIVYEDDDVMVINKQAGLVVHPGVGNYTGTLVNGLVHYFRQKDLPVKEGNLGDRPGLVHRIDKNPTEFDHTKLLNGMEFTDFEFEMVRDHYPCFVIDGRENNKSREHNLVSPSRTLLEAKTSIIGHNIVEKIIKLNFTDATVGKWKGLFTKLQSVEGIKNFLPLILQRW